MMLPDHPHARALRQRAADLEDVYAAVGAYLAEPRGDLRRHADVESVAEIRAPLAGRRAP